MKKILFFILAISIFITSCNTEEVVTSDINTIEIFQEVGNNNTVKITINNQQLSMRKENDLYFLYDDVIYTKYNLIDLQRKFNSLSKTQASYSSIAPLWPGGIVYYEIDPAFTNPSRVIQAINSIQSTTNIRFIQKRSNTPDYIYFVNSDQPYSYVLGLGMLSGQNNVNIIKSAPVGSIIHEIGHKLGLPHEHSRNDRDNHIVVNTSIIPESKIYQYEKQTFYIPFASFDYNSLMIYPSYADFDGDQIFTDKVMWKISDGSTWIRSNVLSAGDIAVLNYLYPPLILSSSFHQNIYINLSWNGIPGIVNYKIYKYARDYLGILNVGFNDLGSLTQVSDYPFYEPDFYSFAPGVLNPLFGSYYAVGVNQYGDYTKESNQVVYGVYRSNGGF